MGELLRVVKSIALFNALFCIYAMNNFYLFDVAVACSY